MVWSVQGQEQRSKGSEAEGPCSIAVCQVGVGKVTKEWPSMPQERGAVIALQASSTFRSA